MSDVPAHPGQAILVAAEALLEARRLPEALQALRASERAGADPDRCSALLWLASMLSGNFEEAWLQSDKIRHRGAPDPHRFWQGEAIADKRVILRCLHGFGDTVQLMRYVPLLRSQVADLTIEVPPRLLALAPSFAGVSRVITWGDGAPATVPPWDVQVEMMELPYLFRTQLADLPIRTQYLQLSDQVKSTATLPQGRLPRVGIAWEAGSWNTTRAIPPGDLEQLLNTRGCEFWSLQAGPGTLPHPLSGLHVNSSCRDTLEGLAATISQLDLIITVDTLAAHLAGAIGKPAWVLLQSAADWRWMHDRNDSPWYPSLRLFRQPCPGDWAGVVTQLRAALEQWLSDAAERIDSTS